MIISRICSQCGAEFMGAANALRCPACRKVRKNELIKEMRHRKSPEPIRYNGSEDICQICGNPYTVTGGRQLYCPACIPRIPVDMLDDPTTGKITSLLRQGLTVSGIARVLNLSHQKVRRTLIALGLYTTPKIQRVQELAANGLSVDDIAAALGISRKNVISMLPYSKGAYKLSTPTATAAYLRQWKKGK